MIFVIDFGGQTAHLITRRLKDLGVSTQLILPENSYKEITNKNPAGLIFSGGPSSVYEKGAPTIDKKIFLLKIPMLDICYGLQLRAHLLDGKVVSGTKEYGPVKLTLQKKASPLTKGLPTSFTVWMSHGDSVLSMPKEFRILGSSDTVKYAFVADEKNHRYGLQFHPEIEHTQYGNVILSNFIAVCNITTSKHEVNPEDMIEKIRSTVGNSYVIGAVSGGVDSTVAGVLAARAIGNHFIPVFVNNGLMREGAEQSVKNSFSLFGVKPIIVREEKEMLKRLIGKEDGEEKRKIIGNFYIELFEREVQKQLKKGRDVRFLLQGTIFSDVIESKGSKHASKIKSHHNVGGLPVYMKLQLLEPLRELYKDEVRALAKQIGLSHEIAWRQVFPGPGYAVRIRGEVTPERLKQAKYADSILVEELQKSGWLEKVYMSFPIMSGAFSTAVKGDGRHFGEVIALRVIESADIMSTVWSRLEYDLLQKISSRIVNEVPGISRVVYDITTKPPATMEWE
ncbi:MAG TPA: glutamine-hydrolyzing GMP synthase [Candidatus Eisenbacteria bacterium]|nr:glutamine-hydrolyzing GMP synthase [Candidatus Eisenbacteria bacterium]